MGERQTLDTSLICEQTKELGDFLSERVINQERATKCIVSAYDAFSSPLWQPEKPILSALFLGPSGVGKTFLPEVLAEYFFESPLALTKIECANYAEKHEVAKLIGSPPGYIGYDDPPLLSQENINAPAIEYIQNNLIRTDRKAKELYKELEGLKRQFEEADNQQAAKFLLQQLRQKQVQFQACIIEKTKNKPQFSIILFDEIEKAHSALHHFLLEVTSKGRTRLGNGEESFFYFSFIFMTSNAGSRAIAELVRGKTEVGFTKETLGTGENPIYTRAMSELKKIFTTEFLGRLEKNIVVFRNLSQEDIKKIIDIKISNLLTRLSKTFPIELIISNEVKELILKKSSDHPEYGARLVEDKIDKYLKEPLGRLINSGQIDKGDGVYVKTVEDKTIFVKDNMIKPEEIKAPAE